MDTDSITQLILIILMLLLSAFFSSAETAFITVNPIKIRALIEEGNKRAKVVESVIGNSGKMLSAILIGNNIVNISASALVTTFTIRLWGNYATGIGTGVLTVLVLLFGEITPKTAATIYSEKIAMLYAPLIRFLMVVMTPLIIIVDVLSGFVLKLFHIDREHSKKKITENELRTFVDVSHEDGVIESEEREIIKNLFDFGDAEVKDVMIPRINMAAADVSAGLEEVIALFRDTLYSRIPVYENDPDNVVGVLNIKDLILAQKNHLFDIRTIMRKPYYIYEHKNVSELFKEMQKDSQSIAIVLDEYGTTVGMVTTEDLLEEIVGDIRDEYDKDEVEGIVALDANTYRIDGAYKLDDLNDDLGLSLKSEDNDSVGGYIIEKLDRFPKIGDKLQLDDLEFTVHRAEANRVVSVILKRKPQQAEHEEEER